ncbi:hypothetical protein pb186bvf_010027 [Paramecium bursaria]
MYPNKYGPPPSNPYDYGYNNSYGYSRSRDDTLKDYNNQYHNTQEATQFKKHQLFELEQHLDNERKQTKHLRQQVDVELDQERKQKLEFEKKLIQLRQNQQENETEIAHLKAQVGGLQQEKESLEMESRQLQNEFIRGQEQYNQKLRELEDRCKQYNRLLSQQEEKNRIETDRMIKSYEHDLEAMQQTYRTQKQDSDAQINSLKRQLVDLNQDLTAALNDNMRIRVEAEEEIRETVVRVQDEEMRKYMGHIRNIEQKLKASDESKDQLLKKYNEQLAQNSEKDRIIKSMQTEFDLKGSKQKQEISEFQNQLYQAQQARDKLRNELQAKDQNVERFRGDFMELQRQMQKLREQHAQELQDYELNSSEEKKQLERDKDNLSRQLNQQERTNKQMEDEIERLKMELESLGGKIQNNIEKSIYQFSRQS